VEIVHDLRFRVPALAWLAEPIIGGFFIDHVARKTLSVFKQHIESSPA
jgi:Na+/glutamate symporter